LKLSSEAFDLVLLDWMPPWRDGIEILKLLRQHGTKPPVLLLTARDAVEDRVLGLDSRADDYLVKPFAFAEPLARLRALLRRSGQDEVLRKQIGDLVLDLRTRQAWRDSDEFVSAIAKANVVSPSGNMNLGDSYPIVPTNAIVTKPSELADVALRSEADGAVFVSDVATVAARFTSRCRC
jgi:CheY-like chemotaxis protein